MKPKASPPGTGRLGPKKQPGQVLTPPGPMPARVSSAPARSDLITLPSPSKIAMEGKL